MLDHARSVINCNQRHSYLPRIQQYPVDNTYNRPIMVKVLFIILKAPFVEQKEHLVFW